MSKNLGRQVELVRRPQSLEASRYNLGLRLKYFPGFQKMIKTMTCLVAEHFLSLFLPKNRGKQL